MEYSTESLFNNKTNTQELQTVSGLSALMRIDGIGPAKAVAIAKRFGSLDGLRDASEIELKSVCGPGSAGAVERARWEELSEIELIEGVRVVCCFDSDWPDWLTEIPSPPALLYYRGTLPRRSIAIVGTRHPTAFGLKVVLEIAEQCRHKETGIVSGLALGIDTAAHIAALDNNIPTWAFLGSGVDVPTPTENVDLAKRIVDEGGGIISEQVFGYEPNPKSLVARNRLQSGASFAVVVAQCGIPSGALHTARFAIEQGRKLVVPRPTKKWVNEVQSAGNISLTNDSGCSPTILRAESKRLTELIAMRKPVADIVLNKREDIESIWL